MFFLQRLCIIGTKKIVRTVVMLHKIGVKDTGENGICYIVGAGDFTGGDLLEPGPADFVIAADGGLTALQSAGIEPDLLLGDFDSLSDDLPEGIQTETFPSEKNYTDMMLAAERGMEKGYRTFCLFGGTGGRMDHTIANIQILIYLSRRGCRGYLIGDNYMMTAVTDGAVHFTADCKGYLSVYAYSDVAKRVNERGLKYGLRDFDLAIDDPRAVSNEFREEESTVSVEEGTIAVLWYR